MIGWIIGIGVLGVGGYLAYKAISGASTSPITQAENLAKGGVSAAESLLDKDPISVTSVGKDIESGGKAVYGKLSSAASTVEGWF